MIILFVPHLLSIPLVVHSSSARDFSKGQILPYDENEEVYLPSPPYVSQLEQIIPPLPSYMRPVDQAIPGKLKDLLSGKYLRNPVDEGVTERINNKLVDEILWNEAKKSKEDGKGTGSFSIGPNQNSELHFQVNARYFCPYSVMGYAVSWVYRLVENGHIDWESVEAGKETACTFSLHVSDITARRMTPGTPNKEINLEFANQFARKHSVPVRIVRGDGWKLYGNETENPTFNVAPIELDEHFQWPEIYKAFYNLTNMAHIARLHARCEQMKMFNVTPFYEVLCPSKDFYDGERAFYGKSIREDSMVRQSAIDMDSLLKDLFPWDEPVCYFNEVAPSHVYSQHRAFIMDKDVPSIFSIDHVKVRSNYLRYLHSEPMSLMFEGTKEDDVQYIEQFTRNLDQVDVIFSRIRGGEYVEHMMEIDKERIKKNEMADCEFFENAPYRSYLAEPWYIKIFLWFDWRCNHVDCTRI